MKYTIHFGVFPGWNSPPNRAKKPPSIPLPSFKPHVVCQDIDKPLAPAEGEGVLLKNPIDVALSSLLGSKMVGFSSQRFVSLEEV